MITVRTLPLLEGGIAKNQFSKKGGIKQNRHRGGGWQEGGDEQEGEDYPIFPHNRANLKNSRLWRAFYLQFILFIER